MSGRGASPAVPTFVFATGIENSYPTIDHGRTRVDEMEACGHYERWLDDFDRVEDLGVRFLRYGPPIHHTWRGEGRYDWSFADETFGDLRRRDIIPITDLCHFGVPDWIGDFQNPDFPARFADYALAFAQRFPWVQLYTPVNEMFICAMFSASYGWWNEQLRDDRAFVTALKHIVGANVRAMHAILEVRGDALFIQSESTEYFHAANPRAIGPAERLNARRFLSLDLNYGRRVESEMYEFLLDNGMTREEYHAFMHGSPRHHCVMGNDYYATNEHRVEADGTTRAAGEVFGYGDHAPVLRPLSVAGDAHGDEPARRGRRRGRGVLAVEGVGERPAAPERRGADCRVHVVLAHRSDRLGRRAQGEAGHGERGRAL
ncbi:MAG: family 1 glycosylhydrolase [Polyangiaceae bacterium]